MQNTINIITLIENCAAEKGGMIPRNCLKAPEMLELFERWVRMQMRHDKNEVMIVGPGSAERVTHSRSKYCSRA